MQLCRFASPPVGFSKRAAAQLSKVGNCGANRGIALLGLEFEVCDTCTKGLVALPNVQWYAPARLLPRRLSLLRRWVDQFILPILALRSFNLVAVPVSFTECTAAQLSVRGCANRSITLPNLSLPEFCDTCTKSLVFLPSNW